jgi:hypothetical protein
VENKLNKINAIPQIARLPPIEDRLGDIRREIAEADQAGFGVSWCWVSPE